MQFLSFEVRSVFWADISSNIKFCFLQGHFVGNDVSLQCAVIHKLHHKSLNSLPIEELGNWCHLRLVGALYKYQVQEGGSMATL